MKNEGNIFIKGARLHNLKNVDVEIPRGKLVVITGLSGSGKSSLAFNTLYAEGQRRYVESLSSYARQFLGRMHKPEVDFIKGIPPAIAIEQKVNTRNPRSTVGTSTEIYDYLKLLYARIGRTYSPVSNQEVVKHDTNDVLDFASTLQDGVRFAIMSPLHIPADREPKQHLQLLQQQGFNRISDNGQAVRIADILEQEASTVSNQALLLIDRLVAQKDDDDTLSRLSDSSETAFYEGKGELILEVYEENNTYQKHFNKRFEADGISFEQPTEYMFTFNNPVGACPRCEGFGKVIGIDHDLVIPNKNLSVYEDAVVCWKGDKMSEWKRDLIFNAEKANFPIHTPICDLSTKERHMLWDGTKHFEGINAFFNYVESKQYKIQYRVMLARYRGKTTCPDCKGTRLKKEAGYVKVASKSLHELVLMPISELLPFFNGITLSENDYNIGKRLIIEITNRLRFLNDVGLSYLTLNRLSNTLSGGESQRINLATSLGSSLVGSMYILDEPSIGLHSKDTTLLIKVLKQLKALGNTVIVVEHDEDIILAADYIIDMGPEAGRLGGEVVFNGTIDEMNNADSLTTKYLSGKEAIAIPKIRRPWNNYIKIEGASANNLKNIDVKVPLNTMSVITGVSGSGKSSLIKQILYPALKKQLGEYGDLTGAHKTLSGDTSLISHVEFVDQNPIGKSSRSNPVTYLKAWDEIRKLFAAQQASKINGYKASHFSFNVEGGRCEECQGEGTITVEMQFMADITLQCESCGGKRFKSDILDVKFKNKNVYDLLNMTVSEAIEFFTDEKTAAERKIKTRLKPLQDVGLGYVKLGQSSSTLSGGESQRVKLAFFLSKETTAPTLFIFDEPTTGLHFHDIKTLLKAFDALIQKGHSIVIIEHNMEVIKCADWIIDLGPDGGDKGGQLVFAGVPENLINDKKSHTGTYLKQYLKQATDRQTFGAE